MVRPSWRVAGGQILGAAVALLCALPLVRIFINSGADYNGSGFESLPVTLAEPAATVAGPNWPVLAPWIRALRAFPAGADPAPNVVVAPFPFPTGPRCRARTPLPTVAR